MFAPSYASKAAAGDDDGKPTKTPSRKRWAWLLRHVFAEDVETCRRCGGPMRWLEVATRPEDAAELMEKCGLKARARPPPKIGRLPVGQLKLGFGR